MRARTCRVPPRLRATAALACLALAGCAQRAGGSPTATPSPAHHYAFVAAGAASYQGARVSLVALNPSDGSQAWSHALTATGATSVSPAFGWAPLESGGVVYVGGAYDTSSSSNRGVLDALDAATGDQLWRHETQGELANALPAVVGDTVTLSSATTGPDGHESGLVEALDARTGAVRWSVPVDGQLSAPALAGGRVFVFENYPYPRGGTLLALNARDGSPAWHYDADAPLTRAGDGQPRAPLAAGDLVFAHAVERDGGGGANMALLALDAATGALHWRYKTGGISSQPAFAGTVACVSTFLPAQVGSLSVVAGLDVKTGQELWRYTRGVIASGCVAASDGFAIAEDDRDHDTGFVVAFARGDGRERWRREIGHPLIADGAVPPAVAGATLLVFAQRAASAGQPPAVTVAALRAADGTVSWQHDASGHFESPPDAEGDVVYLQSTADLAAYALGDGALRWRFPLLRS